MRRSSLIKILVLVPFLLFCTTKNAQHSGTAAKQGEIRSDTANKSAPKDYNQRIIHNSDNQQTVDSLKNSRGKDKK
ncbi:MAG: hypothetical protein WCO02_10820 [Bacteroidota bacterium]